MKTKRYFWQPELSISIIYWSLTFIVLFYGLILTLEKTRPYLSEFNELAPQFPLLVLQWIPEAKNKGADNLARQGLRK